METIAGPRTVKARKAHRCSWCGKRIRPGEGYKVSTLKVDYVYEWRECERCKEYVSEMFEDEVWGDYDSAYGIDQQTFWDFMGERHPGVMEEWDRADMEDGSDDGDQ